MTYDPTRRTTVFLMVLLCAAPVAMAQGEAVCTDGVCRPAGLSPTGPVVASPTFPVVRGVVATSVRAPVVVASRVASVPVQVAGQVATRTRTVIRNIRSRKIARRVASVPFRLLGRLFCR